MRNLIGLGAMVGALTLPGTAVAQMHAVEVTLFMPCNRETADRAIAAVGAVDGVQEVQATVGELTVRILTSVDYSGDPLSLVQVLWDEKIYPNRIYLEATARIERAADGVRVAIPAVARRFVIPEPGDTDSWTEKAWIRAEVLDWIEDRTPPRAAGYSLRVIETTPVSTTG